MSSDDFASELDQSVRAHIQAVRDAAAAAKARIGSPVDDGEGGLPVRDEA